MKLRKESIKSMKMPEARKGDDDMLSMDDLPESDKEPHEAEAGAGEETPEEEAKELAEMSDDMLIEELKKRGYEVEHEGQEPGGEEEAPAEKQPMKGKMPPMA